MTTHAADSRAIVCSLRSHYFIRLQLALNVSRTGARARHCADGPSGYTHGMKTAISLPDAVFRAAERQAKRSKKSRSQLYADALVEYLSRHAPDEVTDAMNRVVDQLDEGRDPFVLAAARSVLERVEW